MQSRCASFIVIGFLLNGLPSTGIDAVDASGGQPLESAEEVEVYELDNLGFADGLISLTKEVVVDGRYDLALLDRAVLVGVVQCDQTLL